VTSQAEKIRPINAEITMNEIADAEEDIAKELG
jgi:hypothetical protein